MDNQQVSTQYRGRASVDLVDAVDDIKCALEAVDALAEAITDNCTSYERNHPGIGMGPHRALTWALCTLHTLIDQHREAIASLVAQEVRP